MTRIGDSSTGGIVKISELKNWEQNPRSISEKDFERLKKQIQKLGQYKPLLINQDNIVLGGNMRLRALQDLGVNDVWVNQVKTKDEAEMIEYALSDNDRAGEYNEEQLAELATLHPIDLELFHVDLGKATPLPDLVDKYGPEAEEDEPPEVDESNVVSKLGEVYQLGKHRLMCGDATKKEDVEKLMAGAKVDLVFTDPPYGIDLIGGKGTVGGDGKLGKSKVYRSVENDGDTEAARLNYELLKGYTDNFIIWGGNYFTDFLPPSRCWIVWDKQRPPQLTFAGVELAWTSKDAHPKVYQWLWDGGKRKGSRDEELTTRVHPTQKPVGLTAKILKEFEGQNVIDLFLGSGSTLIACEQTGRVCYGMEIDPKYVDVIRKRYAKFIDKEEEWEQVTPLADLQS